MTKQIAYKAGYKYQLVEEYVHTLPLGLVHAGFQSEFIRILQCQLRVSPGYAWDGPSGPVRDAPCRMRASLVHDALYQALRLGAYPHLEEARQRADAEFRDICIEDGDLKPLAWAWYHGLRLGGTRAATRLKRIQVAPGPR